MKILSLAISLIFLTGISNCAYSPKDTRPIFPDFAKGTVNIWRVVSEKPLTYEIAEMGVPFHEVLRRQLNKEMQPLVCDTVANFQNARRAWNKYQDTQTKNQKLALEQNETTAIQH